MAKKWEHLPDPDREPTKFVRKYEKGGADPGAMGAAAGVMSRIIQEKLYRHGSPGGTQFYNTFPDWVHGYLEWPREGGITAIKAIAGSRYKNFPTTVSEIVKAYEEAAPRGAPVGNQNAAKEVETKSDPIANCLPRTNKGSTDPAYICRRLTAAGREDLAEQVREGEIKAKQAARMMGWLPDPNSDEQVLKRLRKAWADASPEVRAEATAIPIEIIQEHNR